MGETILEGAEGLGRGEYNSGEQASERLLTTCWRKAREKVRGALPGVVRASPRGEIELAVRILGPPRRRLVSGS